MRKLRSVKTFATKVFLLLLFIGNCSRIEAQDQNLRFEHITTANGLSNNGITKILQDKKGYIWIGTFDGLNKYDGYSFTKYKFDPLDSNSLSQNLVYNILEDHDGYIWVSTFEGLCKFDRKTEKFTRYKPDPKSKFSDPNIIEMEEDDNGILWLGGASGQLGRFDKRSGKFHNEIVDLGFRKQKEKTMLRDCINVLHKDKDGVLWAGNFTGLHKLVIQPAKTGQLADLEKTDFIHDPGNLNSLSSNMVGNIFEDSEGVLWIVTDNGLNSFNKKTNAVKRYLHDPKNSNSISSDSLIGWGVGTGIISEDLNGNLWIGTSKGLNRLNKDRTSFQVYIHLSTNPNSINEDWIGSVLVDRSGILWTGTANNGLIKANLNQKPFGIKQRITGDQNSLSNKNVTAILEDNAGDIWLGTDGGGLNRWNKKTNQFTHFRHEQKNPGSLRSNQVFGVLEDKDGSLWVCNGDILSLLDKQTGQFTHYNSNQNNFQDFDHRVIYSITEDKDGFIWLGTGNGVKRFDKQRKTFIHLYHNPSDSTGISDYTAQAVFADSRNNIWVGYGSIATDRIERSSGRITHYRHDAKDPSSISSNIVNSFYEDSIGNLWLATAAGGLCRFDYKTEKFITYTDKHGLPDNTVYSILEDHERNLWLATANGLSRFDPVKQLFTNYDYMDGLQANFFAAGHRARPSKFKGRDGMLYFGGENGFNFFDPALIKATNKQAAVVITHFKLFDSLIKGANEAKRIVLNHDENYFSFEFAFLSFFNADKNQYAYQLEGVDKDWVLSGTRRYAGYTDIKPGKYVFKVKAKNSDGIWNEDVAVVTVIIRPPWWLTWWAYCVYGLILVAIVVSIHRYQKQKVIQKEREKAQKKELAQAKEIEKAYHQLKETQAQLVQQEKMASLGELTAGIAHEIQNPLNFVNNFSEVNNELIEEVKCQKSKLKSEEFDDLLNNIYQNNEKISHHGKRADAIVKGMLQHSRTSSGQKEATDINALCDEYLRLAYHGLRAKDKSFNAIAKTDFDTSIGKINVVPQDFGRVILNLINNAFYAVSAKASATADSEYEPTVLVRTAKYNGKIEIKVTDNGSGIPDSIKEKIFQPFFTTKPTGQGTGLGLSLSYDIVKAHGGELSMRSESGKGSEFMIQLNL